MVPKVMNGCQLSAALVAWLTKGKIEHWGEESILMNLMLILNPCIDSFKSTVEISSRSIHSEMITSIILSILFLLLIVLSSVISVLVLLLVFIRVRPLSSNVSLLLTCNTYVAIILFCFTLIDIGIHSLYGHWNPSASFAGRWCAIRAYFPHVCFSAYYYSFVCQAIFRLFRIVFYTKKHLQSFGVFVVFIVVQ